MKYITVERDGEVIACIPHREWMLNEVQSIQDEFVEQYPCCDLSVRVTDNEPFMGW